MAYMNQALKAELVAEVKKVLPKNWKVTFGVRNYSTLVMNIAKADFSIMDLMNLSQYEKEHGHKTLNPCYLKEATIKPEINAILVKISNAMNGQNHDNSDAMTDYFDVGYYIEINVGTYKKPYEQIAA